MIELSRANIESSIQFQRRRNGFSGVLALSIPVFARTFKVTVELSEEAKLSEKTLHTINELANLTVDDKQEILRLLFEHAAAARTNVAYGNPDVPRGKQFRFVPLAHDDPRHPCYFENGLDSVEEKVKWVGIQIDELDEVRSRFAILDCYPSWEEEHGASIVVRNGRPIAIGEHNLALEQFDDA